MQADIAAIKVRLDQIDGRLNRIDDRLEAGDRRFREDDKRQAAEDAQRRLALRIGSLVLVVAGAIGMWALQMVPGVAKWLLQLR